MKNHPFGKTGLSVTPIGLGLAALGRPGYINLGHAQDLEANYDVGEMEKGSHAVLDAALAAGVRYFDAARSYGRSEAFLASWLLSRGITPDAVTVGSKWGYTYTADWQVTAVAHEVKEHSITVLERQIQESQELLGNYLNLYQIHSATLDSGVLENQAILHKLVELRNNGLRIGLSLSGTKQADTLRKAMAIRFEGQPLFAGVQATWNVLTQEAGPALNEAAEMGMGIIVKEALANGRLTSRNNMATFQNKRIALEKMAMEQNTTIDSLALAFVLAQPWVSVVLSGAATIGQLQSNVTAVALTLDNNTITRLQALAETPAEYWHTRSQLPWN